MPLPVGEHSDCDIAYTFEACMLLDVRDLKTYFYTAAGIVWAVDGMTSTSVVRHISDRVAVDVSRQDRGND